MRRLVLVGLAGCVGGIKIEEVDSGTGADSGAAGTPPLTTVAPVVVDGEGFACLYGPEGSGDNVNYSNHYSYTGLEDGGSTEVQVVFTTCASCPSDIETSCTATLNATDLVVTSTGTYAPPSRDEACASVCILVTAVCEGPALPAGGYTLSYGGTTSQGITVPGEAPVVCAGDLGVR